MKWSSYQQAVFDFARSGNAHGCVEAVAGSGKSTTGCEMVSMFEGKGLFTSFTRTIVEDLDRKLKNRGLSNVEAKTYNGFGSRLVYRYMPMKPKLLTGNGEKTAVVLEYDILQPRTRDEEERFWKWRQPIIRCVSIFKALAFLSADEAAANYDRVISQYHLDVPDDNGFKNCTLDTYHVCLNRTDIMDFDDQKLFPLLFGWSIPQVDFLVIDEYQDTCPLESELMLRACTKGRLVVFGDRNQAIYSFKGTKPGSMQDFIESYNATVLPLSICYRCSKAVVDEAKKIVPQIEAAENAIEGGVDTINKEKFRQIVTPKDLVLARVTEHLVKSVISFLADGRAAYVEGADYGVQLCGFVSKIIGEGNPPIEVFAEKLQVYYNEQLKALSLLKKDAAIDALNSKYECLEVLLPSCSNVTDLIRKIQSIFTDKGVGIRHMTAHKSKGLESRDDGNVFILRKDYFPHPRAKTIEQEDEERRLLYVAITRAKNWLFYVTKDKDEK